MQQVVVAGHVCLDLTPALPGAPSVDPGHLVEVGALALSAGGCVGNTGRALAGLGVDTRLAAVVGADAIGALLVGLLGAGGADTAGVAPRDGLSTSYSIVVEAPGRDRSFWHHVGANAAFDGTDVVLDDAALLHVGYPAHLPALMEGGAAPLRALLTRAGSAGAVTSLDFAEVDPRSAAATLPWARLLPAILPLVDLATPSVADLESMLPGSRLDAAGWAEKLVTWGVAVAMVTAGADGIAVRSGRRERLASAGSVLARNADAWAGARLEMPAPPVRIVTSTGAGDAASAGAIASVLAGGGPDETAALAVATAAARIAGLPFERAGAIAAGLVQEPGPVGRETAGDPRRR